MSELTTAQALEQMSVWESGWERPDPLKAALVMKALREEIYRLRKSATTNDPVDANITRVIDLLTETRDVLGSVVAELREENARLKERLACLEKSDPCGSSVSVRKLKDNPEGGV